MNSISFNELFSRKFREIEHIHTFKDYFEWIKSNDKDHILFEYGDHPTYNCKYFFEKVNAEYLFFKKRLINIKKDSWIGIKLPNHPFYVIVIFALLKNGYNVLLMDNNISENNCNKVIKQSGISAIVTDKTIDSIDIIYINFDEVLHLKDSGETIESNCFADKIALCSSGTEGNIKISVYDGENFLEIVKKSITGFGHSFPESVYTHDINKIVIVPPFFHLFGLGALFIYFSVGITIVINENNSLPCFLKNAQKEGVQIVLHVPMILDALLQFIKGTYKKVTYENFKNTFGKDIKVFIGAGAGATEKIKGLLKEYGVFYIDCYGTTEAGVISMNNILCKTPDSKIEVYQNETSSAQGYGELIVYGKGIRTGVLENGVEIPKLNTLRENCIETGDLAEIKNNAVFVKGRTNDIIIGSNGENIIPSEIEEYFDILKDYCKYTVLGIKEKPVMIIFMEKEHWTYTYKEMLIEKISKKNREIKLRERITSIYFTLMPIPLTPSLKVKKKFIKEQIKKQTHNFEKVILIKETSI